ncbi:MAG: LapA family protein [Wenzhouxiangellaceae bacterium]|nr:LapA family protein [Wenzhouxiangellaceae bacterium]MBS3746185.1 LapA family protein [Wenzhouxiangellaceae bacterium]MBS3822603.1 LapA family protein [Wenzhouxiangellaceae bacterium]
MWRWLLGLALILGVIAGIVLGALNPDPVTLELAFVQWTASLGAVVALSAGAGLVFGFAAATVLLAFRRRKHRGQSMQSSEASESPFDA